ncbi:MAG: hypothetical protein LUG93_09190 [Lachnospiraceae bacterium]|nr:hypothetical protein [Lachnospiraceae bacterium]
MEKMTPKAAKKKWSELTVRLSKNSKLRNYKSEKPTVNPSVTLHKTVAASKEDEQLMEDALGNSDIHFAPGN